VRWVLVPNPAWKGKKPQKAEILCHDKTPFITVKCDCGYMMHIHRSQIENVPFRIIISSCHRCGGVLEFDKEWLLNAIKEAWQGVEL